MKILFTAREKFDSTYNAGETNFLENGNCCFPMGNSWEGYIAWSGLYHVKEIISLDGWLNREIKELEDWHKDEYWRYVVTENMVNTGLFNSLDYVLRMTIKKERFNLLAVVKEPGKDCKGIRIDGFEFVGYDLLDIHVGISAIANCGGFDETFLPKELNRFGLVEDFARAYDIKKRLSENNPEEPHAVTNVFAVWRHRRIGRWRRYR